jgi:hypothetical protein
MRYRIYFRTTVERYRDRNEITRFEFREVLASALLSSRVTGMTVSEIRQRVQLADMLDEAAADEAEFVDVTEDQLGIMKRAYHTYPFSYAFKGAVDLADMLDAPEEIPAPLKPLGEEEAE